MQIARKVRRSVLRTINAATAADAVGPITHGMEVYGLSKGQFSLVELIAHVLEATGPADLVVSTWTAAGADLAHTQTLLQSGMVREARWLVDFSFPSRQPGYCAQLRERFGDDAIRCTANHAKFVTVTNDAWHIVIRTSMNLNLNRRLESYEISDDTALSDWLLTVVSDAFASGGASSVGEATRAPGVAQRSTQTLSGTIERSAPETSHTSEGKGLTYGPLD